jgi:hypothetical protein
VNIADSWWAYYEYSRADGSHELRRNEVKADQYFASSERP